MSRDLRFWRNVSVIGLAHVALLVALIRWGGALRQPMKTKVVWMAAPASAAILPEPAEAEPTPAEAPSETPPSEALSTPALTPPESEIPLPTPTPTPSLTPPPTPTAPPSPRATAKPTPKPTATKPAKNKAKSPTPAPKKPTKKQATVKPSATPKGKPSAAKKEEASVDVVAPVAQGSGASAKEGRSAAAIAAEANAYSNMLHDRLFGAWVQPRTAAATGSKMAALVQIRIEKDGRVSKFEIARSSGNVVVDESITAVGRRVLKVDPLPAGMDAGEPYEVRIKFELDIE